MVDKKVHFIYITLLIGKVTKCFTKHQLIKTMAKGTKSPNQGQKNTENRWLDTNTVHKINIVYWLFFFVVVFFATVVTLLTGNVESHLVVK